jgi:hypothetical protein
MVPLRTSPYPLLIDVQELLATQIDELRSQLEAAALAIGKTLPSTEPVISDSPTNSNLLETDSKLNTKSEPNAESQPRSDQLGSTRPDNNISESAEPSNSTSKSQDMATILEASEPPNSTH